MIPDPCDSDVDYLDEPVSLEKLWVAQLIGGRSSRSHIWLNKEWHEETWSNCPVLCLSLVIFLGCFFFAWWSYLASAFIDLIRINLRKKGETCCFQFFFLFFFLLLFYICFLFPFSLVNNHPGQFFPYRLGFPGSNRNQNAVAR